MGKINVQCYRASEDITPLVREAALHQLRFSPASSGAEKSTGFVEADPTGQNLIWTTGIGTFLRICIETRKPSPKLVDSVTRQKVRAWKEKFKSEDIPKDKEIGLRDLAKAELWQKMDGESKFYWMCITPTAVYVIAKGSALESCTAIVRKALGTLPIAPFWEGHLFRDALFAYIRETDDKATQHGIEFTEDLTMKASGMQVKLVGIDKLQTDAVRQHLNLVQHFESVGAYFNSGTPVFAIVTPYGGLAFAEEYDTAEHESEQSQHCGNAMLEMAQANKMADMINGLCLAYDDKSRWVNLP